MSARSTAGKRRAAGPAVRGRSTVGGSRKATRQSNRRTDPAGRSTTPAATSTAPLASAPVHTASPSSKVRTSGAHPLVRPDARLALAAAVEALGEEYRAEEWSFDQSTILITLARRVFPTGTGVDLLAITDECYSGWVTDGQDPEEVAGALFRVAPLARNQIAWMLDEAMPYGVGPWSLRPLGSHGWVCSRRRRLGGTSHFVVAANSRWARVGDIDPQAAMLVVSGLLTDQPSDQA